jgi:hypothetical protein
MHHMVNKEPTTFAERLRKRALSASLAVGLASSALAGCASTEVGAVTPPAATEVVETPEATPSAPELTYNYESPSQFDITANASADEIGTKYAELASAISGGNVNTENYDLRFEEDEYIALSPEEYGEELAPENVTPLFDAQFVPGWRDDEELQKMHDFFVKRNAFNVGSNLDGTLSDSFTLESIEPLPYDLADHVRYRVGLKEHYSTDNIYDQNVDLLDGNVTYEDIVWRNVDGMLKISDRDPYLAE